MTNLVWLRNDLRLEDNPALYNAANNGHVSCVYIITHGQWEAHSDAVAKRLFWRSRLRHLTQELSEKNISLFILKADTYQNTPMALLNLAQTLNVQQLHFNHEYPLNEQRRDQQVKKIFNNEGMQVHSYHGDVVLPPGTVTTQQDSMYKVFTPFSRQWHKVLNDADLRVLPAPEKQAPTDITLEPTLIEKIWPVTTETPDFRDDLWPTDTQSIHKRLEQFCQQPISQYKEQRDIPSINGTSLISPYLASGIVSVRQCIQEVRRHIEDWRSSQWVTELIWREFYRHLLDCYPHLSRSENFISIKNEIPWEDDEAKFLAWCEGRTGFPIVDAAMKQLVQTGWMHNRLRMVTAAFLTKILLIDWRKGEDFFMQHLLDGDYASNNGGWQWAASTGADAAPYFRIFNPERQSERFDKEGIFIKKLLPELNEVPPKNIHTPNENQRASCDYPAPIVNYKWARQRALDGYAEAMGKIKKI